MGLVLFGCCITSITTVVAIASTQLCLCLYPAIPLSFSHLLSHLGFSALLWTHTLNHWPHFESTEHPVLKPSHCISAGTWQTGPASGCAARLPPVTSSVCYLHIVPAAQDEGLAQLFSGHVCGQQHSFCLCRGVGRGSQALTGKVICLWRMVTTVWSGDQAGQDWTSVLPEALWAQTTSGSLTPDLTRLGALHLLHGVAIREPPIPQVLY